MSKSGFLNTPWVMAITPSLRPSEPSSYDVFIPKDWSIANLPLGGYLSSLLTATVSKHFAFHHPALVQPDPITTHCAFISRASFGPGIIRVSISKLGRQYSNVIARLYQSSKGAEVLIAEAMITQGNLTRELDSGGISLAIAPPIPDAEIFQRETGVEMIHPPELHLPLSAARKVRRFLPPGTTYEGDWSSPLYGPGVRDEWITWDVTTGEDVFDTQAIVMLIDNVRSPAYDFPGIDFPRNWMATLSMTTDVKKAPPIVEGSKRYGWKWLFLRAVIGKCNFGRYTIDITLLDERRDVVAIGRRVELILGNERRTAKI